MLDDVNLDLKIAKPVYKTLKNELVARLILLQQEAIIREIPALVVFDGWDAAGKGSRISDLVCNLDARAFSVCVTKDKQTEEEKRLPFIEPFWAKAERHGKLTIFDQSWYTRALYLDADRLKAARKQAKKKGSHPSVEVLRDVPYGQGMDQTLVNHLKAIVSFEKQFADDGYIILKFFLHISKEEQLRRFAALEADEDNAWRVTKQDRKRARHYDEHKKIIDFMLTRTSFDHAPWCVVPSHDFRLANLVILQSIVMAYERALRQRGLKVPLPASNFVLPYALADNEDVGQAPTPAEIAEGAGVVAQALRSYDSRNADRILDGGYHRVDVTEPQTADDLVAHFPVVRMPRLVEVRHDLVLPPDDYREQLDHEQKRLSINRQKLYLRRIPMIIALEGWDAAGKGGTIKRLTRALDARSYRVVPSSSPTPEEKKHPFLWRYWTRLPKTGHIAIYDRTWYGRVLVERIEGFASCAEWRRAYDEINEFEWELVQWGAIICKFWVNISSDEQLRRFNARTDNPDKRWKITDEDWRNREKNPQYETAVDDMLRLTSTVFAPWTIIENDDKYYGRIRALKCVNERIEERLLS
ncbi:MAG: phosphate--AMP phosphotransferase [Coriobacteriales bacterium]